MLLGIILLTLNEAGYFSPFPTVDVKSKALSDNYIKFQKHILRRERGITIRRPVGHVDLILVGVG